ncbi:ComF family protein [Dendrosporobacter sp. 1207_IL3150]|uniref:ComF family protein n=1 Tax=Dendrosporobacter sp. 1207_IL3150 TaxID=3084054 RepID=UPI002FD8FC4C
MLKMWWAALLDIIYPPKCPICRAVIEEHGALCRVCLSKILSIRNINMTAHKLRYLDSCLVLCDYTGGAKKMIHDIKFRANFKTALNLEWMLESFVRNSLFINIDIVTAVPLHAGRITERGFNQTEKIFKHWVIKRGFNWQDYVLVRMRPTKPQWELQLSERRKNIRGAFAVSHPDSIKGKNILIVDDIFTTGITMDECAKVLKISGAKSVRGLAIASGTDN